MSNNELQNHLPDYASLSRRLAKHSVQAASSSSKNQGRTKRPSRIGGKLALYTWGTLATLSMIFAAGFLVTEIKIQESRRLTNLEIHQHRIATLLKKQDKTNKSLANFQKPQRPIRTLAESLVPAEKVDQRTTASISKNQERVSGTQVVGFGVAIGSSTSTDRLTSRYLALSNHAPELFVGLKPKVQYFQSGRDKKTAKLIVGPFLSETELFSFCKNVRSRMAVDCSQDNYVGNKMLLPPLL